LNKKKPRKVKGKPIYLYVNLLKTQEKHKLK